MVIRDCGTCLRPEKTIHFAVIITLLLQRGLHIRDYLIGWQIVIAIDRTVVCIICVGIVAPCWIPITRIPVIRATEHENDARVVVPPPVSIMPFRFVISERLIT